MTTRTVEMTQLTCWCGTPFSCPQTLYNEHFAHHRTKIYCPQGHSVTYGEKSEVEQARAELEAERRRTTRLRAEKDQVEASLRAQKGVNTKLRKRVANGVCPCCKRTFKNLARHMEGQHPDYAEKQ